MQSTPTRPNENSNLENQLNSHDSNSELEKQLIETRTELQKYKRREKITNIANTTMTTAELAGSYYVTANHIYEPLMQVLTQIGKISGNDPTQYATAIYIALVATTFLLVHGARKVLAESVLAESLKLSYEVVKFVGELALLPVKTIYDAVKSKDVNYIEHKK